MMVATLRAKIARLIVLEDCGDLRRCSTSEYNLNILRMSLKYLLIGFFIRAAPLNQHGGLHKCIGRR